MTDFPTGFVVDVDAIDPVGIAKHLVEAEFIIDEEAYEECARHADGQPKDVEESKEWLLCEIPDGDLEMISQQSLIDAEDKPTARSRILRFLLHTWLTSPNASTAEIGRASCRERA